MKQPKPLRILLASDMYRPIINGAVQFTYRLATALAAHGHTVAVMAPSPTGKQIAYLEDGVTVLGLASLGLPLKNHFRVSPQTLLSRVIRRQIQDFNPDVIHVQNHFLIGGAAIREAKLLGIPVMGTNHFMPENVMPYLHLPRPLESRTIQLAWHHFNRVFSQLDLVTTPTKSAVKLIVDHGFSNKAIAVSCGIDSHKFRKDHPTEYLMKRYNLPTDRPIILSVSRLDPEKNLRVLVRALPRVLETAKAHVVIAGTGEERERLESLAHELGVAEHVTFTGFVPDEDLPSLYAVGDIFAATGIAELQCITGMEAMATSLPLVAANAVALPELVEDGVNGFLFEPEDVEQLAKYLTILVTDTKLRTRMGAASHRLIQAHSLEATVARFVELYRELIAYHPARHESRPSTTKVSRA